MPAFPLILAVRCGGKNTKPLEKEQVEMVFLGLFVIIIDLQVEFLYILQEHSVEITLTPVQTILFHLFGSNRHTVREKWAEFGVTAVLTDRRIDQIIAEGRREPTRQEFRQVISRLFGRPGNRGTDHWDAGCGDRHYHGENGEDWIKFIAL